MSSTSKRSSGSGSSSSRTPTRRILTELSSYNAAAPPPGIVSLAPVSSSNVLSLRAILSGAAQPPATGYARGRWLVAISIPAGYPSQAPTVTFVTRICHPNVKWETGEVCLDLLGENWTPVLGVVSCLEAVLRLLAEPGVDSPLGVEVAALIRAGDAVGARSLVGFRCEEERWDGDLVEQR